MAEEEIREALDTLREVGNEIYAAGVCGESAQKWWGSAVRDAGDVLERALSEHGTDASTLRSEL